MKNYYKPGVWNCICDACGRKRKSDEVRKRWDGFIVCKDTCWEPRHPLDFIRSRSDEQKVPFARQEATDGFVPLNWSRQPNDNVDIVELLNTQAVYIRSHDESITLTDTFSKTLTKYINESMSLSEGTVRDISPSIQELISIVESSGELVSRDYADSISVTETSIYSTTGPKVETVGITESVSVIPLQNRSLNTLQLNSFLLG